MSDVAFGAPLPVPGKVKNGQRAAYGTDEDYSVEFYKNPVTDKDHMKLAFPGDPKASWDQPVRERDKVRFPRQWDAYQAGEEAFAGQTRIEHVTFVDPGMRSAFKAINIHTVEQLARVSDASLDSLGMGARTMRDKALKHVKDAESDAERDEALQRAREFEAKEAAFEKERADMNARMAALEAKLDSDARPAKAKAKASA